MLTSGGSDSWNVESLQIAGMVPTKNEQEYVDSTAQGRERCITNNSCKVEVGAQKLGSDFMLL